jgi:hypothetical protein
MMGNSTLKNDVLTNYLQIWIGFGRFPTLLWNSEGSCDSNSSLHPFLLELVKELESIKESNCENNLLLDSKLKLLTQVQMFLVNKLNFLKSLHVGWALSRRKNFN